MTRRTFVTTAAVGAIPGMLVPLGCGRTDLGSGPDPMPVAPLEHPWILPTHAKSEPVWGIKNGISVGLWPTEGPRGLLRIYTPYLGQSFPQMVNYIAIEPVVGGRRGQSELEKGLKSEKRGLEFTSGNTRQDALKDSVVPARGTTRSVAGMEMLRFYVATEPFRNGARPVIRVIFRSDKPHEVGLQVHSAEGGAKMDSCVLTATMGNYGRLRRLWLRGEVVDSRKAWTDPKLDKLGFTRWRAWDRERLLKQDGKVIVAATSDEADPAKVEYDASVPKHWRFEGKPGTHYWRGPDVPGVVVRVNGRPTYWGGGGPIPGGMAYENFELEAPFAEGQEFWFGVSPWKPTEMGFDGAWEKNVTGG